MKFPAYRKYPNDKNFFKILSPNTFEELQVVGTKVFFNAVEAKQYPEMVMIASLLEDTNLAQPIEEAEYLQWREKVG